MVLRRLWAFGGVSGIGWCLDTLVFASLVHGAGVAPGPANLVSAGLAVTFVFLVSHERLFAGKRYHRRRHLVAYGAGQVVLVAAAAALIEALVQHFGIEPIFAKVAVTPMTFAANFVLLYVITRAGRRVPAAL